ncbi:hypothetical protein [Streptomyces sp. CAI-85]|uniref:hypothetical protein n=1 Tax=Streptomyces sp. CAI-85 TaxID=1472662 RepID=UPI0015878846|nr:hypothetical protein [Streptomyces sp. CAI-85]NUV64879.1 hypothetical protein [Streptomyces sp. CAI-85]
MSMDPTPSFETENPDDAYARVVAAYSAPQAVAAALERVKVEARRREKAQELALELATRARGGLLHNHTVKEIARYFRTPERGRVDLLQVAESTGIPLSDARQVLCEFVSAGLLDEYEEEVGDLIRRSYEVADGAHGGITEVFVEAESAARNGQHARQEKSGWLPGWVKWGRAR